MLRIKPQVSVSDRELCDLKADCLTCLEDWNDPPKLFTRGRMLCDVTVPPNGKPPRRAISVVTGAGLRNYLSAAAMFYREQRTQRGTVLNLPVSPPGDAASSILASPQDWEFAPGLDGLTEVPVVRPDGSVLQTPGYDESLRLFYAPSSDLKDIRIPANPTTSDVRSAVAQINELLIGFRSWMTPAALTAGECFSPQYSAQ